MEAAIAENLVFALDIGTRSIIGLAGHMENDVFNVAALELVEHPRRAMIDGQIEDIAQVAKIAGEVKSRIEKTLGCTLHRVNVAAAGRALKTCSASFSVELAASTPIEPRTVYELENAAINLAREQLGETVDSIPYYCVGHSVVRYFLDDYPFTTITGHRGKTAKVELIATFLPTEVVNSLRSCMDLLSLTIDTLTLEPIAAMRAVIPQELRLLNLALADIGAGTSDIAVSADGTVAGYTMATIAGDEITEAIIKKYLVDFATAEKIKISLTGNETISFTNILDIEQTYPAEEILQAISPAIDMLADVISEKITECNNGAPAAVFLVGGGSYTKGLRKRIAERLLLTEDKVALAGRNFSGRIVNENSGVNGPEYVTPLGIALTATDNSEREGSSVTINGQRTRLFSSKTSSIMDALLLGGYRYHDLMGRNGKSLTFNLNGAREILYGGFYTSAEIMLNGNLAMLTSPVGNDDIITITPAISGKNALATAGNFTKNAEPLQVTLNGIPTFAGVRIILNGAEATPDAVLHDFDSLSITLLRTLQELFEDQNIMSAETTTLVNSAPQPLDYVLQHGDVIVTNVLSHSAENPNQTVPAEALPVPITESPSPELKAIKQENVLEEKTHLTTNSSLQSNIPNIPIITQTTQSLARGPIVRSPRIQLNGRTLVLPPTADGTQHLLKDLLDMVDIDQNTAENTLNLSINGQTANFASLIYSIDDVEIHPKNN